jgi:hypothetical protein
VNARFLDRVSRGTSNYDNGSPQRRIDFLGCGGRMTTLTHFVKAVIAFNRKSRFGRIMVQKPSA